MKEKFLFTAKIKVPLILLMGAGLITLIAGGVSFGIGKHFWANILLNNYYFMAMSLGAVFFIAVHNIGESGWQTSIQRIPEAMGTFLTFSAGLFLIMFIFGSHELYHWTHKDELDPVLQGKTAFLNLPFFYFRYVVYFAGWILLSYFIRKYSLLMDLNYDPDYFKKIRTFSAIFVVFFALTTSTSSWDWLMSIDAHWFSTLFGWYIFSGLLVSSVAMLIIILLILKAAGYMEHVNKEHLHDLGKYLFAFSILWTYLWFSQYLLIWYGNLPEETTYFVQRLRDYRILFFVNLIVNFGLPFLVLMTRNSKRIPWILGIAAIIVFIGHWIDYYLVIMPGTTGNIVKIGFFEIGLTLGYLGLFLYIVLSFLTKANLSPENHPFFKESMEYHTNY